MVTIFRLFILFVLFYPCVSKAQNQYFDDAQKTFEQGEYKAALQLFEKAKNSYISNQNIKKALESDLFLALCLMKLNDYSNSLSLAMQTLQKIENSYPEDKIFIATAQKTLGEIYIQQGKNKMALELMLKAEKLSNSNKKLLVEVLNLIGIIYWNNYNQELALQYHKRALAIKIEIYGEKSLEAADTYNNIGLIYLDFNDMLAKTYFENALDIYKKKIDYFHPKIAYCLTNLAIATNHLGNMIESLTILEEVLDIWTTLSKEKNINIAFTLNKIGQINAFNADYTSAIYNFEQGLAIYTKIFGSKHPEVANSYISLGNIYMKTQEYEKALLYYQEAVYANLSDQSFESIYETPQLKNYLNTDVLLSALMEKANALEMYHKEKTIKPRDLKCAINTYKLADSVITIILENRFSETDKLKLSHLSREIYENGIRSSLKIAEQPLHKKEYENIFYFFERSKASILLNAIKDTNAKSFANIPQSLINLEDSLKENIAFLQQEISNGNQILENEKNLFLSQTQLRDFLKKLEIEFPNYYHLKNKKNNVSIKVLQKNLNESTAVLTYLMVDDNLYYFLITKDNFKFYHKLFGRIPKLTINGLRNAIMKNVENKFYQFSIELYDYLIPSIPKNINQLLIIPDGNLSLIPFEVLINPKTEKFLIEDYNISYDYSNNLFLLRNEIKHTDYANKKALFVAPVEFDHLHNLPSSEKELNTLNNLFLQKNIETKLILKKDANEGFIKNENLLEYEYLHFATHGIVNENLPEKSRVIFNPSHNEDGHLYISEVYNLKINANLIALSACETGVGKISQGEGIIGLSRALLYSGGKNLLVSLWGVSDEATSLLMINFYYHYLNNPEHQFAKSLRDAKLKMLINPEFRNPYYWSSFVLIGQ